MSQEEIKALRTGQTPGGHPIYVVRERINKLLGRTEVDFIIVHVGSSTPSRKEVRQALASIYGVGEDVVVVRSLRTEYGIGRTKGKANIYESKERVFQVEPKHILRRNGLIAEGGE